MLVICSYIGHDGVIIWKHFPYTGSMWEDFTALRCIKNGQRCPAFDDFFYINTLRPRQNGRHFPDDIIKHISLNENQCILIKISQ